MSSPEIIIADYLSGMASGLSRGASPLEEHLPGARAIIGWLAREGWTITETKSE